MAKRKQEEPKGGSPAWMSTFSDLMNLLLCFFVLLFASSTIDAEKMQQIAASFAKDNIFQAGSTAIGDGQMMSSGVRQLSVLENFVTSMGRNEKGTSSNLSDVKEEAEKAINTVEQDSSMNSQDDETQTSGGQGEESQSENSSQTASESQDAQQSTLSAEELEQKVEETGYQQSEEMAEEIEAMLESAKIQDMVSLDYNAQYVELSLSGGILFESGEAELTSDAQTLMSKVGDILVRYRKRTIEIDGHTDNVPVSNGYYKDNQFLSAARAISVYEYLLDNKNLIAANMKHSGYGDSRPKASNDTAKGRAKNRRVEIKIYNKISSDAEQN